MKCLEVSGAVRPIYESLGVKRLRKKNRTIYTVGSMKCTVITKSENKLELNKT